MVVHHRQHFGARLEDLAVDGALGDTPIRGRTLMVLLSNIQLYAGIVRPSPDARVDDGWLDVVLVADPVILPRQLLDGQFANRGGKGNQLAPRKPLRRAAFVGFDMGKFVADYAVVRVA